MIVIKQYLLIMIMFLSFGCIEPNAEELWSIEVEQILSTNGYARDVSIDNNRLFIAAGEAGAQIWDINNLDNPLLLKSISLDVIGSNKEIYQVHYSPINNLLHLLEYNERPYVGSVDDSSYNVYFYGQYGAEDTRDFVIIDSLETFIAYTVIKKDHFLKCLSWESVPFGPETIWGEGSYESEIDVNAIPTSITLFDQTIVIGIGQMGIQIWNIESINADPVYHYSIDLDGAVESVKLFNNNDLYVSSGNYGVFYIPLNEVEMDSDNNIIDNRIFHFALDLNVDHISVNNGIAILSLGSKGIAIYDVTDPFSPKEKGIFPIGYVYKTEFWGEKLLVCSREGLQIITIDK